ncbi:MAG: imidazolonepropionase [Alphaproteobacteria bacterium]|nr:imidazolonepropionase [Alphaproteobacteria bacterium]
MQCDRVWTRARLAPMAAAGPWLIEDGIVAARGGRIVHAGPAAAAPRLQAAETIDCGGRLVTPGLIDCHTHLVFAGDRAAEFEKRIAGASYEEIARGGGGIVSTVAATRAASEDDLLAAALPRLDALLAEGVTTVEVKSGYGLTLADETKMLRAARLLGEARDVRIVPTFLGAHAVPGEMKGTRERYLDLVCDEMIPAIAAAGLASAVDAFCEGIAFSPAETARVFEAARRHGLPVKLHADQLSDLGGGTLAARYGALSADHLEHLSAEGAAAMARAGTVAVLLPGAYYFTRETRPPPVDLLRRCGVPIALATDCNPGTSPLTSILMAMNMGATLFRLTVAECLAGVTREAAAALGLGSETGALEAGKACDLAIWNASNPAELVYRMGFNPLHARVREAR